MPGTLIFQFEEGLSSKYATDFSKGRSIWLISPEEPKDNGNRSTKVFSASILSTSTMRMRLHSSNLRARRPLRVPRHRAARCQWVAGQRDWVFP